MTRAEALAIAKLWHGWNPGLEATNRIYREFVYGVVAGHRQLRHLNCYEVLDAVTNEVAWRALGQRVSAAAAPLQSAASAPAAAA